MQLEEKPARTITELAERTEVLRPSVSRSLRILREQGLVNRERNGWCLTEAGMTEASAARVTISETVEKMQRMAEHIAKGWGRPETFNGMSGRMDSLTQALGKLRIPSATGSIIQAAGKSHIASAMEGLVQATEGMQTSLAMKATESLGNAIIPLVEAQKQLGTLLSELVTPLRFVGVEEIVRQNNLFMARAIDDVLAIHQAGISTLVTLGESSIDFASVSIQLSDVNQSFEQLIKHQLKQIDLSYVPLPLPLLTEGITVPTATVANYTNSLRDLVEAETEMSISPRSNLGFEEFGDPCLDPLLNMWNPDFVEMRRGSWAALHTDGPDYLRHAATSQRELISQVLETLVPNIQLPEDGRQGPQTKARVRKALEISESDAKYICAVCEAVYSHYRQLSKYTHRNKKHEESLRALMHAGEGLLRFILVKARARDKQ